jgi:hypothetical protein
MQVLLLCTLTSANILSRIIRIPFTGSVKLRSLLLKAGPTDQTPEEMALVRKWLLRYTRYTDCQHIFLSSQTKPTSTLKTSRIRHLPKNSTLPKVERLGNMPSSRSIFRLTLVSPHNNPYLHLLPIVLLTNACRPRLRRAAKFSNVSSITLFFPKAQGAENTQIYYVGLFGHWTEVCLHP